MNDETSPLPWMYRSEAFAEDLLDPTPEQSRFAGAVQRATLLAVPLGLALLGGAFSMMGSWA